MAKKNKKLSQILLISGIAVFSLSILFLTISYFSSVPIGTLLAVSLGEDWTLLNQNSLPSNCVWYDGGSYGSTDTELNNLLGGRSGLVCTMADGTKRASLSDPAGQAFIFETGDTIYYATWVQKLEGTSPCENDLDFKWYKIEDGERGLIRWMSNEIKCSEEGECFYVPGNTGGGIVYDSLDLLEPGDYVARTESLCMSKERAFTVTGADIGDYTPTKTTGDTEFVVEEETVETSVIEEEVTIIEPEPTTPETEIITETTEITSPPKPPIIPTAPPGAKPDKAGELLAEALGSIAGLGMIVISRFV